MKKIITIILIIISLAVGYISGYQAGSKEITGVSATDAGVQITYEDGTGYWYEY